MIRELKLKPDLGKSIDRFEAWWRQEILDRPPISVYAPSTRPYRGPTKQFSSARERWMDVEFTVEAAAASMQTRDFLGDTFPCYWPNLGPEITATLYGCELEFGEVTSWSKPVIHNEEDWRRLLQSRPNFDNPYWRTIEQMTQYAAEICDDRYLVGFSDLHGNYDILAALRDPQELCTDLIDCPDLVNQAGHHVARGFVEAFERGWRQFGQRNGSTTWCAFLHDGPAYVPSSDFWCMMSPTMAREMVWPAIQIEMGPLQRSIFHLDGEQALPHLDLLLNDPKLSAVQWVFGAGHGPAANWIEVYQRVLSAGKSIELTAETPADAMAVLEAVGCKGVWVHVYQGFASAAAADSFIKDVERMCLSRK